MSESKIYQDETGLREQYLALLKAEQDTYDKSLKVPSYQSTEFAAWRAAADAVYEFQQAHKEMFDL
jgi:inorganic pyrophosphatase